MLLGNSIYIRLTSRRIGDILTTETGFKVSFESAIVPQWRKGVIRLHNVNVLCNNDTWTEYKRTHFTPPTSDSDTFDASDVDINWTYWNLNIEHADVTLSLMQWFEGRGLVTNCKIKGVSGVVDREHIIWSEDWKPVKRRPLLGDFELERFVVEDMKVILIVTVLILKGSTI